MRPKRYTSIIIASHIPNELRAKMFRTSLESLFATTKHLPVEIIVVDNGGDEDISDWIRACLSQNLIQCYIKNSVNLHFGLARNQGIASAYGDYICIADNDIFYRDGWLEACLTVLEEHPRAKIYATPIDYPMLGLRERYDRGFISSSAGDCRLNMRAGSNCFVMRRNDFYKVGLFTPHRVAGTKWTDRAVGSGYLAAVVPGELISDLGLRLGYNLKKAIPIERVLTNGERVTFNEDEYGKFGR
jgi:GT2 family glycosyltransferase